MIGIQNPRCIRWKEGGLIGTRTRGFPKGTAGAIAAAGHWCLFVWNGMQGRGNGEEEDELSFFSKEASRSLSAFALSACLFLVVASNAKERKKRLCCCSSLLLLLFQLV